MSILWQSSHWRNLKIWHSDRMKSSVSWRRRHLNYNKFQDLVEKISKTYYDILVLNTICNATQERQVEARQIASQVDVMIVIGGKNSSNTQKVV